MRWGSARPSRGGALILRIDEQIDYKFTRKWGERETCDEAPCSSGGAPQTGTDVKPVKPVIPAKPLPHPEAKPNPKPASKEQICKRALVKSFTSKNELNSATTAATDLLKIIGTHPDWDMFNSEKFLAPIKTAMNQVAAFKDSTQFWKDWVMEDKQPANLIKDNKHEIAKVMKELGKLEELNSLVSNLRGATNRIKHMKTAHDEACK